MKKIINQKTLLLIIVILFWFAQYVYIPFQNPYLAMRNVSANMIGIIIGAYGIAQCLLRFPVGIFADSIGKHKCFIFLGIAFAGLASCVRVIMLSYIWYLQYYQLDLHLQSFALKAGLNYGFLLFFL